MTPALTLTRATALSNKQLLLAMSALLIAPTALAAIAFKPLPAIILLAGCVGTMILMAKDPANGRRGILAQPINLRLLGVCIIIATALLFYAGALHVFHATLDWRIRDAVLADLTASGFPSTYRLGAEEYVLRAPLGMYMGPAAIGGATSLYGAHVALWFQNSFALGVILYFACTIGHGARHGILLLLSGTCAALPLLWLWTAGEPPPWARMLALGMDAWHPTFQYSSTLVQYFWVPNHAIPGWWIAVVFFLHMEDELDGASVVATSAAALFWSPLVVFAAPILLLGRLQDHLTSGRMWLAALLACFFAPLLVFFSADASTIPLKAVAASTETFIIYVVFALALAPQATFVAMHLRSLPMHSQRLYIIALGILFTLPFMRFGTSNDLVMRGSIVPLAILWYLFAHVLIGLTAEQRHRKLIGWSFAALCSLSAVWTLATHALQPRWPISDCSVVQSARNLAGEDLSPHYHARWLNMPEWLITRDATGPRPTTPRDCWSVKQLPESTP